MSDYTRDPLDVLIEREEKTCKGCVWAIGKYDFLGDMVCAKDKVMRERCGMYVPSQPYIDALRKPLKR